MQTFQLKGKDSLDKSNTKLYVFSKKPILNKKIQID